MDIKTTLDNSREEYPKNLRDIELQLNYDKESSEAKVSINSYEFVEENAELLLAKANGEGLGIMFGVPFKIEVGNKGVYEKILDGVVDLSSHDVLSCREVVAPVIEKGGNDFLNEVADSFTFEYLHSRVPLLLNDTHFKYVPYVKNRVDNVELASAVFNLISIIIALADAIEKVEGILAELKSFSWEKIARVVIYGVYIGFLLRTLSDALQTTFDMIIAPIKFHAGMSALELCQIGAAFKGYQFSSTILEDEFPELVIIPPKYEIPTNDTNSLITGFTQPKPLEQRGFYDGTFGDLLRDLITTFNGKILIEESAVGGQKVLRFERDDYNNSNELYTLPPVDNDGVFKYNTDEFKAIHRLSYSFDDQDINTYQYYLGSTVMETLEPIDSTSVGSYDNFMKGIEDTTIPFTRAIKRTTLSRADVILRDLMLVLEPLIEVTVTTYNVNLIKVWEAQYTIIEDIVNPLLALVGKPAIEHNYPNPQDLPFISIPDYQVYIQGREDAMLLEGDNLSVHRICLLGEGFTTQFNASTVSTTQEQILSSGDFSEMETNLYESFTGVDLRSLLLGIEGSGDLFNNKLIADNNERLRALNIYTKYHQIKSFLPTDERPLGNQWKIIEIDEVDFCYSDYLLLKNDNKFLDSEGNSCLLESLTWNLFSNKASIRYRINQTYLTNIQLKDGNLIESSSK